MAFSGINQKIIMVTGKGGVGKSAVSAALAQKYANQGQKTLLVELGEHSYYEYVYGQPIAYKPTEISKNFSIALWGGAACLREYVFHLIRVEKIVDLFFNNKVMKTFIRAAPGLKELAILGKITSGIRRWGPALEFDIIVVDGFSTGHFLALLRAPMGMNELVEFGPMGEQSRNIIKVLSEEKYCQYVVVTLAEELPVTESAELCRDLFALTQLKPSIYCNKVYECGVSGEDLRAAEPSGFVHFLTHYLQRQSEQLEHLKNTSTDTKNLPLVFSPIGRDVILALERSIV